MMRNETVTSQHRPPWLAKASWFACVAIEGPVVDAVERPIDLGSGLWALGTPPVEMSDWWAQALGSILAHHYAESTLFLWSSGSFEDGRRTERMIHDAVRRLYLGVLMSGVPPINSLLFTAGNALGSRPDINAVSTWPIPYRGPRDFGVTVTEQALQQAATIAKGLAWLYPGEIFDHAERPIPLRRGFYAWRMAFEADDIGSRLHQFVRSVEALVQPRALRGASHFGHRCQTFTGASSVRHATLRQLYRLRSANEHMRDLHSVLEGVSDPAKVLAVRCLEAETLASGVFARILTDGDLRQHFVSDSSIQQFWRASDSERRRLWGPEVPFEAAARVRFIDPL